MISFPTGLFLQIWHMALKREVSAASVRILHISQMREDFWLPGCQSSIFICTKFRRMRKKGKQFNSQWYFIQLLQNIISALNQVSCNDIGTLKIVSWMVKMVEGKPYRVNLGNKGKIYMLQWVFIKDSKNTHLSSAKNLLQLIFYLCM